MVKYTSPKAEVVVISNTEVLCTSRSDRNTDGLLYDMGYEDWEDDYGFKAQ